MINEALQKYIDEGDEKFLRHVTFDCAVFCIHEDKLKILLSKFKYIDGWSLPSMRVFIDKSVDESAEIVMKEYLNVSQINLHQFKTFSDTDRINLPGITMEYLEESYQVKIKPDSWLVARTISVGFYAFIDHDKASIPPPTFFTSESRWFDIDKLPTLLFDHTKIVREAIQVLRRQLSFQPFGIDVLPRYFTLPELRRLYEVILGRTLDPSNFRKKILRWGILTKSGHQATGRGGHKPPDLYTFNKAAYKQAAKNETGINL